MSKINLELPVNTTEIDALINIYKIDPPANHIVPNDSIYVRIPNIEEGTFNNYQFNILEFRNNVVNHNLEFLVANNVLRANTLNLGARTRFNIISTVPMGDLKSGPTNILSTLFHNDKVREDLREIIHNEFGLYSYLDPTSNGNLSFVLSKDLKQNEKSLDKENIEFFKKSVSINQFGDGIQAYVGILLAVMTLPSSIILIDEPEAFLHPPTAHALGRHLTDLSIERNSSLIVATHSPEFVLGCLERDQNITLVRLTYDNTIGTAKQLRYEDVRKFITDPLLRSANTLSAMFHKSAVVTEADQDRVFYSHINQILLDENKGISDVVFLNAQNKHTIHRMVGPLRKIGIPAAAIYDLDVIKKQDMKNENTTLWFKILTTLNVPKADFQDLDSKRETLEYDLKEINNSKKAGEPDAFKKISYYTLKNDVTKRLEDVIDTVKKYGIFIVPVGELEQWLLNLDIVKDQKGIWLVEMLDAIQEKNPDVKEDKIGKFIMDINTWISNSDRDGMIV